MRKQITLSGSSCCLAFLMLAACPPPAGARPSANIHQATLMESEQKTREVSTEELRSILAEIGRMVQGNQAAPIVLYCNGPFCGKSKRLARELLDAGYTNVRRYQLGIPVWRALGGLTQIEPEGLRHVIEDDRTAVSIDAREAAEFKAAKDDGRLPMEDHNTRIIVFGRTAEQAKAVAEAIAKEAFHNVSFFDAGFEQFKSALQS